MEALRNVNTESWRQGSDHMILTDIFQSTVSVAIWQRESNLLVEEYFRSCFNELRNGVRQVFSVTRIKSGLAEELPEHHGKQQAIEDIYLLADMLTCLFNCEAVGLRLAPLNKAMCPKLHTDNIPVRLVSTYLGSGTQWLPREALTEQPFTSLREHLKVVEQNSIEEEAIQQMSAFDVGLLKGSAWDEQENMAAIHRSCAVANDEQRVVLTLDPM